MPDRRSFKRDSRRDSRSDSRVDSRPDSSKTSQYTGQYSETAWSEWSWNNTYNCESRCRQDSAGEWQYEYRDAAAAVPATPYTPRDRGTDPPPLDTIRESSAANYEQTEYSYDAVASISQDLAETSISTGGPIPQTAQSRGRRGSASRIRTQNSKTSVDLDPNFKVYKSKEFYFGRIFKVLWSEPCGSNGTQITEQARGVPAIYGENAYHSIRRFLIVDKKKGHCICLPILTYGGQGTLKHGIHPEDHAMIYTLKRGEGIPDPLPNEVLRKRPVRMIPSSERHKLDDASRLNYAKIYTVEHNVKVQFVGHIDRKHEQQVVTEYNKTHILADRPTYEDETPAETYEHTQGVDPIYPAAVDANSNRNPQMPYSTPSSFFPVSSSYQASPAYQAPSLFPASTNYQASSNYQSSSGGYPTTPYQPSTENSQAQEYTPDPTLYDAD